MASTREIRADFDRETVVVYQAFPDAIAEPALAAQRLVPPFSLARMTWIKPSLLWLMHRSGWARRKGQERILAVRITRAGWEEALGLGVLTHFEPAAHGSPEAWSRAFAEAPVHLQWDPERSLRGARLAHDSIQVGLGRAVSGRYAEGWVRSIADLTERVRRMRELLARGRADQAERLLPPERPYPLPGALRRRLGVPLTARS